MATLFIVQPSHPVLSQIAAEVPAEEISTPTIQNIIQEMLKIAGAERGSEQKPILVGLAAPQIGISKRIILVDTQANEKGGISTVKVYINPKIISKSSEQTEWYEACYSTGEVTAIAKRAKTVTIIALNEEGNSIQETHHDYIARIFQHEIDHLDGIRVPDIVDDDQLYKVKEDEFYLYRNQEGWRHWPHKCTREEWEKIKLG
jgi:peptide deformylase